jgi:hypothetical protein
LQPVEAGQSLLGVGNVAADLYVARQGVEQIVARLAAGLRLGRAGERHRHGAEAEKERVSKHDPLP